MGDLQVFGAEKEYEANLHFPRDLIVRKSI